jgi:hypothetical protein
MHAAIVVSNKARRGSDDRFNRTRRRGADRSLENRLTNVCVRRGAIGFEHGCVGCHGNGRSCFFEREREFNAQRDRAFEIDRLFSGVESGRLGANFVNVER